ncbi:selenide, water dikinase SelD [Synechococcus sp. UW105]|uniref:selenide, water dikinase SelD n=1 Tax=Synechococcus sp. UW105 TaxID=337067 RepID=UPI000E0EDAA8|nr:selenide, water dikinase SelD [Synechococcus sp. UW105]
MASDHLILAGGGHSHALLLKRWAMQPLKRPKGLITLVSSSSASLYSGLVPAYIAGLNTLNGISIDIRWLAQQAGVAFIQAKITGLNPDGTLLLLNRPALPFDRLSLNVGAITNPQGFRHAIPIKPLQPALEAIAIADAEANNAAADPFQIVGAGLAAVEVALSLRRRWPGRRLHLYIGEHQLRPSMGQRLDEAGIVIKRTTAPDTSSTLLCTGSHAPHWLAASGLPCDARGRVRTHASLQVVGHPQLLAAGDSAVIDGNQRPPSGVWAVRAAKPLARNLERLSHNQRPLSWTPQRRALQLLGCAVDRRRPSAWMLWGPFLFGPHPWLWRWKRHLDHRFLKRLQPDASMAAHSRNTTQNAAMACRGCAAKLPAAPLEQALQCSGVGQLSQQPEDAQTLGTTATNTTLLSSVDGFPALIADPWLNGRLTTLHACSDLWASGARVSTAQAIVTVPAVDSSQQVTLLSQTLEGIQSALAEQGATLIGGHTMESRQASNPPMALDLQLSLSVSGCTASGQVPWRKGPIQRGDLLLLSRSLGSGVLFAAAMQGRCAPHHLDSALQQLSCSQHPRLNELLALSQQQPEAVHSCTDVTGFGLLGHLNEMVAASEAISVNLLVDQIPSFAGALECLAQGITSTLAPANRRALASLGTSVRVLREGQDISHNLEPAIQDLLIDPQTCGPLLVSCSASAAATLQDLGWTAIARA